MGFFDKSSNNGVFNKFRKFSNIRFALGMILVGLLFSVCAFLAITRPQPDTAEIRATITQIDIDETKEESESHVFIAYNVDGKNYKSEISAYDSRWKVGDLIDCKYELENPESISYTGDEFMLVIILCIGLAVLVFGILRLVRDIKKPSESYAHYDRVDQKSVTPEQQAAIESNDSPMQDYVFHFTGKLNQSHVMKDQYGEPVFMAESGNIKLAGKTDFDFINEKTGDSVPRKIGHTTTTSIGGNASLFGNVSSSFKIDDQDCWDFLAEMGYSFTFSIKKLKCHYNVKHYGVDVGTIETAGTEVINDKYKGNPLAKIPSAGIYRIQCQSSEAEGFFYICFCLAHTDLTLN